MSDYKFKLGQALEREEKLRKELESALSREDSMREEMGMVRKAVPNSTLELVSLQQRLTVAEKLLQRVHQADALSHCCPLWKAIDAALKPTAECVSGEPLHPVDGDKLPPIGSKVLIHLGSSNSWAEHTVAGYYVWGDLNGNPALHRVFVRVTDSAGHHNARLLKDVRASAED